MSKKTKTKTAKLMTEEQVKQALFDLAIENEPALYRSWDHNKRRYITRKNYESTNLYLDNQLLLKSVAALVKKQPKKTIAAFEVTAKDFLKIKEEVAGSCLNEDTKDAIAAAMGVTFDE